MLDSCCAAHTLRGTRGRTLNTKKTPHAPARARLPLLRFRPGGVGLDGATWGAGDQCSGSGWEVPCSGHLRRPVRYCEPSPARGMATQENSPSGLWRTLGKRVGCKPSGVRIPHSPPVIRNAPPVRAQRLPGVRIPHSPPLLILPRLSTRPSFSATSRTPTCTPSIRSTTVADGGRDSSAVQRTFVVRLCAGTGTGQAYQPPSSPCVFPGTPSTANPELCPGSSVTRSNHTRRSLRSSAPDPQCHPTADNWSPFRRTR